MFITISEIDERSMKSKWTVSYNSPAASTKLQMDGKKGQFDIVKKFRTFSIDLNAQHVNGMTNFKMF